MINPKKASGLIKSCLLVVFLFGFNLKSFAQFGLGTRVEDWGLDRKEPAKEVLKVNKYDRPFLQVKFYEDGKSWRSEAFFLNGECVQIRLILLSEGGSWEALKEEALKAIWELNFFDEKIEQVQKEKGFVAYWGENGGLMSFGRGKNKGVLNLENAKMRFVSDKYLRSQIKAETPETASKLDEGLKMTGMKIGGRMKPVYGVNGGFKGYMSDKGLFFNENMEYEGWVNSR